MRGVYYMEDDQELSMNLMDSELQMYMLDRMTNAGSSSCEGDSEI